MKKVVLAGFISALAAVSVQADYQFEANLGYFQGDTEGLDFDGYALGASIYFESVDTSKGPLSEAAFLDKASSVNLAFATTEFDDFDGESDVTLVSGRFVFGNDFIIEAGYTDLDFDKSITFGFGKYLTDSSEIVLSFTTFDDADANVLDLTFHSVNDLAGSAAIAYDLGASYIDADETGFGLNGGLTYYPSSQLGLGVAVNYQSIDDFDSTGITLNAEYFFNENVAGALSYSTQDDDDDFASATTDTITLGVTARF